MRYLLILSSVEPPNFPQTNTHSEFVEVMSNPTRIKWLSPVTLVNARSSMLIQCPNYGEQVKVSALERKPLNIPLKIICEMLQTHQSVVSAAQQLGYSQGYIYNYLKDNRLTLKDLMR